MAAMRTVAAIFFAILVGAFLASLFLAWPGYLNLWAIIKANDQTSAVLFTALVAAVIAIWGIFSQRAIARRVFTIQFLSEKEVDKDLIDARKSFIKISQTQQNMTALADSVNDASDESESIRIVLNYFELIAIGIQRGVIDFRTYKLWHRTGTINTWNKAETFIMALRRREGNPLLYNEFENLTAWLRGNKKAKRRGHIFGHWFW